MGIMDLRRKYGENGKSQVVLNRAVRAEIPGGQRILALMDYLYTIKGESKNLNDIYNELQKVKSEMLSSIARKYDLKTTRDQHDEPQPLTND